MFGLLAIILGVIGRGRAKRGEANNGGLALAGVILGALGLLISVGLIALGASLLNSDSVQNLQECLASMFHVKGRDTAAESTEVPVL